MTAPSPSSEAEKLEELLARAAKISGNIHSLYDFSPTADVIDELAAACRGLREELVQADIAAQQTEETLSRENAELQRVADAAAALKFGAYPAHGSGFVIIVNGGNIDDLASALAVLAPKETGK